MVNQPSLESELAGLAVTGTLHGTYSTRAAERLDRARELASQVSPELVAKVAVFCREHGKEVDLPAMLVALLAARDVETMSRVFPRVVDDGATLRSFVRVVRSGVTGRKSFGSAPKRAIRSWFAARTPDVVFRQSIGESAGFRARPGTPSMSDVIKMVRPPPRNDEGEADAVREALYGYLIGKSVDRSALPPLAKAFDAFKRGSDEGGLAVPDVPFEMLTALPLRAEHWTELVKTMKTPELRAYLATLRSHGIFADPRTVEAVAKELTDACSYRRTRVMPLAVLTTLGNADVQLTPVPILAALAEGLDHAAANVPRVDGRVVVAADVSGSMTASFAGDKLRCVDVAALVAAVLFHRNEGAEVLPFAYDVLDVDLDRRTPAFATLDRLSAVSSGNTRVSAPLERLAGRRDTFDLLVVVSDNRAWTELDFTAWDALRARNPNARLVLVDLRHRGYPEPRAFRPDVLHVSGFSDSVFDVLAAFARGDLDADHLRTIEEVVL